MVSIRRVRDTALHTLAGAYALDALEPADRVRFERHLARCDACAQEVRGLHETTSVLGSAAAVSPPWRLRERVLTAAARTRQYAPPAVPGNRSALAWHRLRISLPRVPVTTAVVSLAAAVAFGIFAITVQGRLDRADQRNRDVAAVLTARDAEMMTAPVTTGGRATVVMSPSKRMIVFSAKNLRALSGARSYELWLMGPAGVRRAGTLPRPSHGMTPPMVVSGLASGDRVGLTVERGGGSLRPTTRPVLMLPLPFHRAYSSNAHRVGDPVKSALRMPKTRRGRTPIVALTAGSRKLRLMSVAYFAFIKSITRCSAAGSVTIRAVPSTTTGSLASSVVTTQRGSRVRFRVFRDRTLLLNQSVLSSHTPQTGITCGLPSSQTLATQ